MKNSESKIKILHADCLTPKERFLRLWSVAFEMAGKLHSWTFASRKEQPEIISGSRKPDAVVIIAYHPQGIVVTKEFRVPIGGFEFAFPAGLIDGDESPEDAAKRELKQETGLEITHLLNVSPQLYSSAGMTDESVVYVEALVKGELSKKFLEETEDIHAMIIPTPELKDLVYAKGQYEGARISAKAWPILWAEYCNYTKEELLK